MARLDLFAFVFDRGWLAVVFDWLHPMIILTLTNMQVMGLRLATFRPITPGQVPPVLDGCSNDFRPLTHSIGGAQCPPIPDRHPACRTMTP